MITTQTLVTPLDITSEELVSVMDGLDELGWSPVVLSSQRELLKTLGVEGDEVSILYEGRDPRRQREWGGHKGDVFSKDNDLFYLIRHNASPEGGSMYFTFDDKQISDAIEVGMISTSPEDPRERLRKLSDTIQTVVMSKLDGRKTRHLKFDWRNLTPGTKRLDKITKDEDSKNVKFVPAKVDSDQLKAGKALELRAARDLAIQISKAGVVREADILHGAKNKRELSAHLEALKDNGIITPSYVLECSKTKYQLLKLKDPKDIEEPKVAELQCPHCGKQFRDEEVGENYAMSERGKELLQGSQWQTIVVTGILIDQGVPPDLILWNITEASEEVDILAEVMDELWLFELKDREFGAGDAHPLNYRLARYNSNRTFVVTTDKVSKDAKKVLGDLAKMSGPYRRNSRTVYVEGHEKLESTVETQMTSVILGYTKRRIASLGRALGYDLGKVLSKRFGIDE